MKVLGIGIGLLVGNFISRAIWLVLFWLPGLVIEGANDSLTRLLIGWFLMSCILAVVISIAIWATGNIITYGLCPRSVTVSAILAAIVGFYVGLVQLICPLTGTMESFFYNTIIIIIIITTIIIIKIMITIVCHCNV